MALKSFITGIAGTSLTADEGHFVAEHQPWGFILFARNIEYPAQLKALTAQLRSVTGRNDVPILVDQEGGRVQRLKPPHWAKYPSAGALAALYDIDQEQGARAIWLLSRLHAFDLADVGLNVNCLPVLDVPIPDGHDIISDRAYGDNPAKISALGQIACDGLLAGGVKPVMKHMPGHGRAIVDTHHELPVVDTPRSQLEAIDFAPFKALSAIDMAMTAHVIYSDIDKTRPATTSKTIISTIIRDHIGFSGLLMSDDLSMRALSGDFGERTRSVFEAGCDIVLHCCGDMAEMKPVATATPELVGTSLARAERALSGIGDADLDDEAACRAEFEQLCNQIAVA